MIQILFELEGIDSIKAKRSVVRSCRDKLQRRFHLSAAEVDLRSSPNFEFGAA
jgi:uncharacterized protein YlxP (DUF503 family)